MMWSDLDISADREFIFVQLDLLGQLRGAEADELQHGATRGLAAQLQGRARGRGARREPHKACLRMNHDEAERCVISERDGAPARQLPTLVALDSEA